MDCSTGENGVQEISLLESLNGEWLKLPLAVMRDVGPAVQTLGGLLEVTKKETYTAVTKISTEAHLPVGTVRRHLRARQGRMDQQSRARAYAAWKAP